MECGVVHALGIRAKVHQLDRRIAATVLSQISSEGFIGNQISRGCRIVTVVSKCTRRQSGKPISAEVKPKRVLSLQFKIGNRDNGTIIEDKISVLKIPKPFPVRPDPDSILILALFRRITLLGRFKNELFVKLIVIVEAMLFVGAVTTTPPVSPTPILTVSLAPGALPVDQLAPVFQSPSPPTQLTISAGAELHRQTQKNRNKKIVADRITAGFTHGVFYGVSILLATNSHCIHIKQRLKTRVM